MSAREPDHRRICTHNHTYTMAYTAAPLCILTQNCRGLNTLEKRSHLLRELKNKEVMIALLQETHLKLTDTHRLKDRHYPANCHSTHPTSRKAGISLYQGHGIAENLHIHHNLCPERKTGDVFTQEHSPTGNIFTEGTLIIGGDFNALLDPLIDPLTGHSSISQIAIRAIRKTLRDLRLVDTWRTLHLTDRDYTHYSAIHRRYSRIDYILIQQEGLQRLQSAEILPTPCSDHSTVYICLDSPLFRPTRTAWRLNESLLSDPEVKTQLIEHLNNYFTENDTEDVSKVTLWEAHKSVLWGHFIRIASHKKKEAQQHMMELTDQITKLETQHKWTQLEEQYRSLLEARRQLAELVARKHHRATQRSKAFFFYIHANKSRRLLARMIQKPTDQSTSACTANNQGHPHTIPGGEWPTHFARITNDCIIPHQRRPTLNTPN
ncbi:Hypothetical predicted protein [Pelobates cultripes]|uniref:Endonuclease/exonuclease/phosphatase domain-containing protein n=1 Tax=Pelobates cultripes TaxID=61616 RepID=A0AAD1VWQ8_PELCU|nr:Hypothetical predicted protein [Pelobates cultripes]